MAPRKRTTKQPKSNPKTAKLEAFLDDFDSEVKTRVVQLKEKLSQLLKDVDNGYNMAIIKLPKAVRQLNWIEHCSQFKHKRYKHKRYSQREEQAAIVESVVAEDHAVLLQTVKKISSNLMFFFFLFFIQTRATKKPPTTSKRAKALSVNKQNSTIRRSNRKPLVTPARTMMDSSIMMGPTPLVTPRFDPRLPKTPAVRVPRHKERVYSISVNGSPIAGGNDDVVISVPIGNGESIQLLASQMDSVDLSLLDETALRSIQQLQNRLTSLCGLSK
ncbi:hypothetical protein NQD34_008739 [Periophthalmus magnuspinnatus]|nr:hypothetical protein NQD34_008739 [Periophthalmus magnuspinnatus]